MSAGRTTELELKFRVTGLLTAQALVEHDWSPFQLTDERARLLEDTILDTDDERIINAGWSFRLRRIDDRAIITLKGPQLGDGHLHHREEVEIETSPDASEQGVWPAEIGAALARVPGLVSERTPEATPVLASGAPKAAIGMSPSDFRPALRLRNRRVTWHLCPLTGGPPIAEVALDLGAHLVDGQEAPFHEIEIELSGGSTADLPAIESALVGLPIVPEPRSKLEQGLAFRAMVRGQRATSRLRSRSDSQAPGRLAGESSIE